MAALQKSRGQVERASDIWDPVVNWHRWSRAGGEKPCLSSDTNPLISHISIKYTAEYDRCVALNYWEYPQEAIYCALLIPILWESYTMRISFILFFFSVDNHITHFPFSPLKHMLIGSINGLDWTYRTESLTPHFSICQHCTQPEESDCGGPLTESGYFTLESQTAPLRHFNLQMLPVNEGDEMRDENERAPQLRRIHEKVSWHCVT